MIILLNKNSRKQLSEHFNSREFECPCCRYALIDTNLPRVLEDLRRLIGRPVDITSGYRCPSHNKDVKGGEFSRHLLGCAADVSWAGAGIDLKDAKFRDELVKRAELSNSHIYGIGWGQYYIHIDTDVTRKKLTQWTY